MAWYPAGSGLARLIFLYTPLVYMKKSSRIIELFGLVAEG